MNQAELIERSTDYDVDFYRWGNRQAELLRRRRFSELDLENLIDEVEDMSKRVRDGLESSYRRMMLHLLKWSYQPSHRSDSWRSTIVRERGNIKDVEEDNPSLAAAMPDRLARPYRRARREAAAETRLPLHTFPTECPFTLTELRDDEFLPE